MGAALLPTHPFIPSPWGPKPRRLLQPSASRARGGREFCLRGGLVTHRPVSLLRNLPPHTPWPLGRTRQIVWVPEVGERVPRASKGQVGPQTVLQSVWGRGGLAGHTEALGDGPPGSSLPAPPQDL